MYAYNIEQAIRAAAILHQDQFRKGAVAIPYISHLASVVFILRDYTNDEDTLIAAWLHDTLEDTDYTVEELEADFGKKVAKIVTSLSEPKEKDGEKLPWMDRKKAYAAQLKKGSQAALMIAAADKSHNFRSIIEEYYGDYARFVRDFGPHMNKRMEAYQLISNSINAKLKNDIVHEFNHTFDEYKNFITDVQKSQEKQ